MKAFRCQTENVIWVMVRYVPVAWCVRQFLRRGTAQLWVLLSRADRDRRADRSGFVLLSSRGSNNVVQPPGTQPATIVPRRTMKIDKDAVGQFFDGTPGKSWDDYASRLKNAAAGEVDERGYSLADEFEGIAEGQPGGPPMPGAAGDTHNYHRVVLTTFCGIRDDGAAKRRSR